MEEKKFYAMLYETNYIDSGIISYKPIKLIKGFYDKKSELFIEDNGEVFFSVNKAVPTFGKYENHMLDALSDEIEVYDDEKQIFFAFPIKEEEMIESCKEAEIKDYDPFELYEREVRCYFLYSVYDTATDDNFFYVADKFENHYAYNVDVNSGIIKAVTMAINMNQPSKMVVFLGGGNAEEFDRRNFYTEDEEVENEVEKEPIKNEEPFDFDPDKLEEEINSEVLGQSHVVKSLVSMMYKNKRYHNHTGLKSNMLILGPSGCGKTEIVRSMSRHLNIPMTIFDATSASASGYVGNSVTQAIKDLISVCSGDIKKAENGIIVIDEIDKLASLNSHSVSKGDVQDELFKMLEGDEITVAGSSYSEKSFRFNPKNVTFIGIGSAQTLIEEKKKIHNAKKSIGFGKVDEPNKIEPEKEIELNPEDLIKFGLKPELLRRLNVIKVVKNLSKDDLVNIITNSKISNLRLYENAFKDVDHVKLVYDDDILCNIAEKAKKEKAGASGLKRVVDDMLQRAVIEIRRLKGKEGELVLSKETIDNPEQFELYSLEGTKKEKVYPPKVKVKKIKE